MTDLTFDQLLASVAGEHVAIRVRTSLQPAGGPDEKIFPATYGVPDNAVTKYAVDETRDAEGKVVQRDVLVDSVAAQAHHLSSALLDGLDAGELSFPDPYVDFTVDDDLVDLDRVTTLTASHRIADAVFRDSLLHGTLFRLTDEGREITEARPAAATGLYRYSPTALLFGMWDSTGPKGGLGSKFQRCIVSEIVGFDADLGVTVSSRIDPLQIEKKGATIYEASDPDEVWVLDPERARQEKGKPVPYGKGEGEKGRPSQINHGNVTPSIIDQAGGVRVGRIEQIAVLSLAGLRKLRFPIGTDGRPIERERRREAETAARTAIAALGVAALAYQVALDYDLRSRCLLVPTHEPHLELLGRTGGDPEEARLDRSVAASLLAQAAAHAAEQGLGWAEESLRLEPTPKLIELIKRSRAVTRDEVAEQ